MRGEIAQQIEPPVPRVSPGDTGVGLIDDHEFLGAGEEFVASLGRFDEVQADNGEGIGPEYALARREVPLQTPRRRGRHSRCLNRELGLQLVHPLLHQVGRAEHRSAIDLATVIELTQDKAGLNGLADADVVGDQQADDIQFERHQERDELIRSRLETDAPNPSEGARTASQR